VGETAKADTGTATLTGGEITTNSLTTDTPPTTAQKELTELLAYVKQQTIAGVEGSKALVSQQAPLVAKEIVAYKQAQAGLGLIPFALLLTGMGYSLRRWLRAKEYSEEREACCFGFWVVAVVTSVSWLLASPSILKPFFAPRLVVLDYIRNLL